MKFAQHTSYIAKVLCFLTFFYFILLYFIYLFIAEALLHPVQKAVRGNQKSTQIPRSIVIFEKELPSRGTAFRRKRTEKGLSNIVYVLLF